jgi:membrane protein implicated in regulation of membrane protease activity
MNELMALYIGLTVFGAGITLIDLFGIAFSHGPEGQDGSHHGGGHDGSGSHVSDHGMGHEASLDHGGDHSGDHGLDHSAGHDGGHTGSHETGVDHGGTHPGNELEHSTHHDPANTTHQQPQSKESVVVHDVTRKNPMLIILSALRNFVYFSLGFGPVGWFVMGSGTGFLQSLFISIPVGVFVLAGVRILRRIQTKGLDSQVQESEFLLEKAEVIVSIEKGRIGKVRISLSGRYLERYAKAADANKSFPRGSIVRITSLTDENVIVEEE